MSGRKNFYETLGVSENATTEEIKKVWKRLVIHYHPDRNRNYNSILKTQELNEAWETLKDPIKRHCYDIKLRQEREMAESEAEEEVEWENNENINNDDLNYSYTSSSGPNISEEAIDYFNIDNPKVLLRYIIGCVIGSIVGHIIGPVFGLVCATFICLSWGWSIIIIVVVLYSVYTDQSEKVQEREDKKVQSYPNSNKDDEYFTCTYTFVGRTCHSKAVIKTMKKCGMRVGKIWLQKNAWCWLSNNSFWSCYAELQECNNELHKCIKMDYTMYDDHQSLIFLRKKCDELES